MSLSIRLFGAMTLHAGGLEWAAFPTAKSRELFAYLLLQDGDPVPRSWVCHLLWPEASPSQQRNRLSVDLYGLRRRAAEAGFELDGAILATRQHLRVPREAVDSDWRELLDCRAGLGDTEEGGIAHARRIVGLTRRPFLPECLSPWTEPFRQEAAEARQAAERLLSARVNVP